MLYGIDFGCPVGVSWAQGGRRWLSGVPQVAVWGRLVAVRGRLGTHIGMNWPIWTPQQGSQGVQEGSGEGKPKARGNISAWEG